jgi:cytochrome c556
LGYNNIKEVTVNNKLRVITAGLCTAFLLIGTHAVAEDDSEQVIKYRQKVMKSLGGHSGAISSIVKKKVKSYDDQLIIHAEAIAAIAKTYISLFPEGSDFGETKAKPEVWDKRADFEKAAKDAEKAAAEFLKVVKSGKSAEVAFKKLGESCKNCHKSFREK